jgi:TetR/AcrR family mexXY operon transcriptional repressor
MGRKTKEDTLKTVEAILDAAELVFVEKGVANTTMADIADRASLSRGAVYGHYKDKITVCVAVCERAMESSLLIGSPVPGEAAVDSLKRIGVNYLRAIHISPSVKNALEIIYLKCEKSAEFDPIQRFRNVWEKRSYRITSALVQRAINEGGLPSNLDVRLSSVYLQSLLEGISGCLWCTDQLKPDPWPAVERFLSAGVDSLKCSPALLAAE